MGSLEVLNCNAGHLTFTFDKEDPLQVEKARRAITDMLARGYAIFVEREDGTVRKVKRFDRNSNSYILSDTPEPTAPKKSKKKTEEKVPMQKVKATRVAPTAGG